MALPFPRRRFLRRAALFALTLTLLPAGLPAAAPESSFTQTLSAVEQTSAGISKLGPTEKTALDLQISREITLARQGDVVGFAKSFLTRRTPEQATAAGLGLLSAPERAELDRLVATAVARRPSSVIPRFRKPAEEAVETVTYRPQLHGEVSLTYGVASGGRSFYGGSFTAFYDDPAQRFSVDLTYAEYHGKGLLPFDERDVGLYRPLIPVMR